MAQPTDGGWVPSARAPSWIGAFQIGVSPIEQVANYPVSPELPIPIKAFLYLEYRDDDNLQAFIDAFNEYAQSYMDWLNSVGLPVYIGLSGPLLDWVAQGVYGFLRPLLATGASQTVGPFGTVVFGEAPVFGEYRQVGPTDYYLVSDDVFKRILTWHLYRGDGKQFSIPWLKRRVMRFLFGENGTGGTPYPSSVQLNFDKDGDPVYWPTLYNVDNTYPVSVSIAGGEGTIIIAPSRSTVSGAIFGTFVFGTPQGTFGLVTSVSVTQPIPAMAPTFKAAVDAGVLELPFQLSWTVQLG